MTFPFSAHRSGAPAVVLVVIATAAACSGAADLGGAAGVADAAVSGDDASAARQEEDNARPDDGGPAADDADRGVDASADAGRCPIELPPYPNDPLLPDLGATQGVGLRFVWLGANVQLESFVGRDVAFTSDAPLDPNVNTGFWVELRDANGGLLFTRGFFDPTSIEAPPPPDGGSFSRFTVPWCDAKRFSVDVANLPNARTLDVYAPPYGTQGLARLLKRFVIAP